MNEENTVLYCANHPNVETTLRCNRCEKPICPRCAVLTETGYRCKECVRGMQKTFNTANWYDYPLAIVLAGGLSFFGSLLVPYVGFFTIFIAPIAGTIIAEVIRYVLKRRRAKSLFQFTAGAAALGSSPLLLSLGFSALFGLLGSGMGGFFALLPLIWQGLYTFTVATTVYYRLGGIQIR
jgi:hypothetical protein